MLAAGLLGLLVVQVAYRTDPLVPVVLAGAAALLVLSVVKPVLTLYAAVALAPLELLSFQYGGAGISPSEGMLAASGLGWAVSRIVRGELPVVSSPLGWPLGLLVAALVPGIAIVDAPFSVIKVLVLWTAFFFVYQMIVLEGTRETVRDLLFVLALSAAVVGMIAVVASGGSAPDLQGAGDTATGRAQGSFGHPNTLATFEALAMPGALALGLAGAAILRPFALVSFGDDLRRARALAVARRAAGGGRRAGRDARVDAVSPYRAGRGGDRRGARRQRGQPSRGHPADPGAEPAARVDRVLGRGRRPPLPCVGGHAADHRRPPGDRGRRERLPGGGATATGSCSATAPTSTPTTSP